MAASFIIRVLTKVPWKELLKYGPVILDAATGLLARNKAAKTDPADPLEIRIARLEQNEKDQAELVKSMAERQEVLVQSIDVLNARLKLSFLLSVVLAIGLIYILVR